MPLLFSEKIPQRPFVLSGIAIKARGNEVAKTVVPAFDYRLNMIYRGREAGQLFSTVTAFIFVSLVDLNPVFPDVVIVGFTFQGFGSWLCCGPFSAELAACLNFIWDKNAIQRSISIGITVFTNRPYRLKSGQCLTDLLQSSFFCASARTNDTGLHPPRTHAEERVAILSD